MQSEFKAALDKSQTIQDEANCLAEPYATVNSTTPVMAKSGAKSATKIATGRKSGRQSTTVKKASIAKIKPLRF